MPEDFDFESEGKKPEDFFLSEDSDIDQGDLVEKEVQVVGVFEHPDQNTGQPSALVLVKDVKNRSVPIFIGKFEAMAIWLALEGTAPDRPLTHDLLHNIIVKFGGQVERILIDDLWNNTYYAKMNILINGKSLEIDSRPSDAIALALRAKAPIFMAESVLNKAAVTEE